MERKFRFYQEEAYNAIIQDLEINNKCLVKMFCGSGKSLIILNLIKNYNSDINVLVFPSLNLIDQFYNDYLVNVFDTEQMLKVCSESTSTTNPKDIELFLLSKLEMKKKIICVTYQSFKLLLDNLNSFQIDFCCFDEAHHAVGETYQKLIFENDIILKQVFFTATPKNANGIVMYDRENIEQNQCGNLVYDYTYLDGVNQGYLNPFEIRIDMYTENSNKSIYESIARAILVSGNGRVLTFHSAVDSNSNSSTTVNNFVNEKLFKESFKKVLENEFPEKKKFYKLTDIHMKGLDSKVKMDKRKEILKKFDETSNNKIMIISSCETIGEGVDTKNANMCVFVDPKSSFVKIIQNIGRIVRKQFGVDKPNSTILIPCWVDKSKYENCNGDKEKCDEVIRQDMMAGGNFNGILNVMSALKQEDEDLYDICLNYPSEYSPIEIHANLNKQGYEMIDSIGDGELFENVEYLLDEEIDYELYEDCESDEDIFMNIAQNHDVIIEVHNNSLENPIEVYKPDESSDSENSDDEEDEKVVIRVYREYDENEDMIKYQPIVEKDGKKKNDKSTNALKRNRRLNVNVHINPDVKVLWNIMGDIDFTKDICSYVIDCEVLKYDPMEVAKDIVERAKERERNGGRLIPRGFSKKENRNTFELEEEYKDSRKLGTWRQALKGKRNRTKCCDEVRNYLDLHLIGWRIDLDEKSMEDAVNIVKRAKEREKKGGRLIPKQISKNKRKLVSEFEEEHRDATKLDRWKQSLKGLGHCKCPNEVRDYLDIHLIGWRDEINFDEKAIEDAKNIVKRAKERENNGGRLIPRQMSEKNSDTPELIREYKDSIRLSHWKNALKGKGRGKCSDEVRDYLDIHLIGWRDEINFDQKALEDAINIVKRAKERKNNNKNIIPRKCCKNKNKKYSEEELQEHKDGSKLGKWKEALKGKGRCKCSDEVRNYLDLNLKGWRTEIDLDEKALEDAKNIVIRCKERVKNGGKILPRHIHKKENRNTEELEQENNDAVKLGIWKQSLKGNGRSKCSEEVKDYLDTNLTGWRTEIDFDDNSLDYAINIVKRAKEREKNGKRLLPRFINKKDNRNTSELEQEHKDAQKLMNWKQVLKGKGNGHKCSDEVRDYLDLHLPEWRVKDDETSSTVSSTNDLLEEVVLQNEPLIAEKTKKKRVQKSMKLKLVNKPLTSIESQEERKKRCKSELSILHQKYKTMNSQNLHKEFKETKDIWIHYHEVSEENEKSFPEEEIPRNIIIKELEKIKTRKNKTVVDLGCGKGQISKYFEKKDNNRFTFINYDHVAIDESIKECDISNVPLEDNEVEYAILSLAMWGSNCNEYIKEAYRILESSGRLYIIEATKRWTTEKEHMEPADRLRSLLNENGFKILEERVEKFSLFICQKM